MFPLMREGPHEWATLKLLAITQLTAQNRTMQRGAVMDILKAHESELKAVGVAHLRLFGSVARGDAQAGSDIDVLADFAPAVRVSLVTLGSLQVRLKALLGTDVDISASAWLRDHVRERALQESVLVF